MRFTGCPKGKWPFRFHRYEFKSDLQVWGEGHWLHNTIMSIKGNNIVEVNRRYVCSKCGIVVKTD